MLLMKKVLKAPFFIGIKKIKNIYKIFLNILILYAIHGKIW